MKKLLKNKPLAILLAVLVLILCGLIVAWQSALYTLNRMSLKVVTPTQMAAAMRQDEFWSSNRFNTLIFEGKVESVTSSNGKTTLNFVSLDSYGASCELNDPSTMFKVGQTYKFAVETYHAEREPNGVLLHNCLAL